MAVAAFFGLALTTAGLQMIEPLFVRFIIDHVLLNGAISAATRLARLNLAGAAFLTVILLSNLTPTRSCRWRTVVSSSAARTRI